jgi:hypothetical protein
MVNRIHHGITSFIQGEYRLERESEDRIQTSNYMGVICDKEAPNM